MKKIFIISFVLLALPAFALAQSTAYQTKVATLGSSGNQLTVQLSTKVNLQYMAGTLGLTYSASAYHDSGNRTFMSTSEDAPIYYSNATGTTCVAAPTDAGTSVGGGTTFPNTL